jgi:ribose/xylose/arabinose/galactoside ABC-type transport system permease subunit
MRAKGGSWSAAARLLAGLRMELILVVLCVVLAWVAPNFLTPGNLFNVLRSISMQGVIAFGMTLVIIVREIDLSVGAHAAFAGCLIAWLTGRGVPIPVGAAVTVGVGAGIGAFTGVMRAWAGVPTFITTLALLTALRGAALMITGGFPITSFPEGYAFLGGGTIYGVPFPALVLLAVFAVLHGLMLRSRFGRAVYAAGGNPEAARLSGIDPGRVRIAVLALTGALAALGGILLSARINSGTPTAAQGWELDVIAGVIIGGTSLAGGEGSIWGTLVGMVFIGVIGNGMTLLNVPEYPQYLVRGFLIFLAVLLNRLQAGGRR